jgi:hypothetical protein
MAIAGTVVKRVLPGPLSERKIKSKSNMATQAAKAKAWAEYFDGINLPADDLHTFLGLLVDKDYGTPDIPFIFISF